MIITPSSTFSRPANTTAYTAADLVANDTTAVDVTPMQFSCQGTGAAGRGQGKIRRVRLFKDAAATTNANFSIHLFSESPTVTNGDNGAFAISSAQYHLGAVAVDMTSGAQAGTADLIEGVAVSPEINFNLPAASLIYGLIEAEAGYTPASGESFTVTLEIEFD